MSLPTLQASQNRKRMHEGDAQSGDLQSAKRVKQDSGIGVGFFNAFTSTIKIPFCKMAEWVVKKKSSFTNSFHTRPISTTQEKNTFPAVGQPKKSKPGGGMDAGGGDQMFQPVSAMFKNVGIVPAASKVSSLAGSSSTRTQPRQFAGSVNRQNFKEQQNKITRVKASNSTPQTNAAPLWKMSKTFSRSSSRSNSSRTSLYDKTFSRPFTPHNTSLFRDQATTAQRSVDLKEKEVYRQLLQRFTSTPASNSFIFDTSFKTLLSQNASSSKKSEKVPQQTPKAFWTEKLTPTPSAVHVPECATTSVEKPLRQMTQVAERVEDDDDVVEIIDDDDDDYPIDISHKEEISSPRAVCPSSEEFKSNLLSSPYAQKEWLQQVKENIDRSSNERRMKISKEEVKIKVYQEMHEKEARHLEEQMREQMRLTDLGAVLEESYESEDDEEEEEVYPELTPEMEDMIDNALVPYPDNQVLVSAHRIDIKRKDMATLGGLNWLNDEVINFYVSMLTARGGTDGFPKVHSFNTFFYPKLLSGGHASLKRWTRRVDVLSVDYIVVPVHLGMHWCLAVVDFPGKCLRYYDSMGGNNMKCLRALRQYLQEESLDKKKVPFDMSDWTEEVVKDIPQQMNGSDCGMFACKYAEYVTRNAEITFTQEHMPYFRRRMVYEILTNTLL